MSELFRTVWRRTLSVRCQMTVDLSRSSSETLGVSTYSQACVARPLSVVGVEQTTNDRFISVVIA